MDCAARYRGGIHGCVAESFRSIALATRGGAGCCDEAAPRELRLPRRAARSRRPREPPREAQDNAQLQTRAQAKAADVAAEKELRRQEPAALSKRRQEPAALSKDERQAARNAAIPVPQVTPLRDSSALPGAAAVPPVSMPETPKVDSLAAGASPAGETARFRSPAPAAPPPAAAAGTPAAEPPPAVARRPDAAPPSRMTETVLTATPDMLRAGLVPDAARQIVIPSADPRDLAHSRPVERSAVDRWGRAVADADERRQRQFQRRLVAIVKRLLDCRLGRDRDAIERRPHVASAAIS